MTYYTEVRFWKCEYCDKEYLKYEDALECAEECADIQYPKEDEKILIGCDFCKQEYEDEDEAEGCEEHYAETQDKYFSQAKLKEASEHPEQNKLITD